MTGERREPDGNPQSDTPGFLVLLVLAALVGAALIAGGGFLLRWLGGSGAAPGA